MDIKLKENIPLKDYATFRIGGLARYFFVAKTQEDLIKAVKMAKKNNLRLFVFSDGSNILFPDEGFKGLVVKCQISGIEVKEGKIKAGSGVKLKEAVKLALDNSLKDLAWAAGVPGTLGGAIFGNAQAFKGKMSDIVEEVKALDTESLEVKKFSAKDCRFSSKESVFKKRGNLVIISAVLNLEKGDREEIEEEMTKHLKYRKEKHPLGFPSAGSVFVNLETKIENPKLLKDYPELKEFNEKGFIPSGFLIEKTGLKGKIIGNAQISEKHANFIINLGEAKAKDVKELIALMKKKVKEKFNIELKEEIRVIHN